MNSLEEARAIARAHIDSGEHGCIVVLVGEIESALGIAIKLPNNPTVRTAIATVLRDMARKVESGDLDMVPQVLS